MIYPPIVGQDGNELLLELLQLIRGQGQVVDSRVGGTLEIEDLTIVLPDSKLAMPDQRPGYATALGLLEGAQLVGGFSNEDAMRLVAPRIDDYSDFYGAYGPRIVDQLPILVRRMIADRDTRQAILTPWIAEMDLPGGKRDHPCTLTISFRIRRDQLNMTVHMRSNDVWRGWCYDVVQFAMLHQTIANVLHVEPGRYVHHADSFHLYESDFPAVQKMLDDPPITMPPKHRITGFGLRGEESLRTAMNEAVDAVTYGYGRPSDAYAAPEKSDARLLSDLLDAAWRKKQEQS